MHGHVEVCTNAHLKGVPACGHMRSGPSLCGIARDLFGGRCDVPPQTLYGADVRLSQEVAARRGKQLALDGRGFPVPLLAPLVFALECTLGDKEQYLRTLPAMLSDAQRRLRDLAGAAAVTVRTKPPLDQGQTLCGTPLGRELPRARPLGVVGSAICPVAHVATDSVPPVHPSTGEQGHLGVMPIPNLVNGVTSLSRGGREFDPGKVPSPLRPESSPGPANQAGAGGGSVEEEAGPFTIPVEVGADPSVSVVLSSSSRTPTVAEMAQGIAEIARTFSASICQVLTCQGMRPLPIQPGEVSLVLVNRFSPSPAAVVTRGQPSALRQHGGGMDLRTLLFRHNNDGLACAVDVWVALLMHAGVRLDTVDRLASPGGRVVRSLASYDASVDHSPNHTHDFLLRIVYEDRAGWPCGAISALTMTGVAWGGDNRALRVLCGVGAAPPSGTTMVPVAPLFQLKMPFLAPSYWQQRQDQFRHEVIARVAVYGAQRGLDGVGGVVMAALAVMTGQHWELGDIPKNLKDGQRGVALTLVAVIMRENLKCGRHFTLSRVASTGAWQVLCGTTNDGVGRPMGRGAWPNCLHNGGSARFSDMNVYLPVVAAYGCSAQSQGKPQL